ncbi:hypothetical protein [Aeromonas salmonicida]|uniref:hypothetical protein n=1 Tax=Aeromonas salmonicida TaxID=645 RepID=UPI003D208807
MKTSHILLLSSLFFVKAAYSKGLEPDCNFDPRNTFIKNVSVQLYNINGKSDKLFIRTSNSHTDWYQVSLDRPSGKYLYDMAKTARLTGELVNICINSDDDNWLIGMSWANSAK